LTSSDAATPCDPAVCPTAAHSHVERQYSFVQGSRAIRIHVLDVKVEPRGGLALVPPSKPAPRRLGRRAIGLLERGGLTRRELEVLRLVANGQTDREIAQALVLSPRTIEMHVANCLGKLGCRSRAHAVRRAVELNLLDTLTGAA
jgi:DNA-binding NarL/FixJ family response regulator